jgi:GNAT superfamily N-acetyltransferase
VAEVEGVVVGYAFFALGYSTDVAARSMWLHDLFVAPAARRCGVGSALMAAVALESMRVGAVLQGGVHSVNTGALEFCRRLGAGGAEVRIMGIDGGGRLRARAAAAPGGTVIDLHVMMQ